MADEVLDSLFFDAFNEELAKLECGARVQATDADNLMEIIDLDGKPIGKVIRDIEPSAFVSFMLVVEDAYADGIVWGRANPEQGSPPTITVQ